MKSVLIPIVRSINRLPIKTELLPAARVKRVLPRTAAKIHQAGNLPAVKSQIRMMCMIMMIRRISIMIIMMTLTGMRTRRIILMMPGMSGIDKALHLYQNKSAAVPAAEKEGDIWR